MAEYCREYAERYLGPEEAEYSGGLCKQGETVWEFCEGCADVVEMDHKGNKINQGGENEPSIA